MRIEIVLRTNEFFLLSLPAEREEARERLPTAPAQLKMKGFDYKKITRFALQIFLLYVKFPSFSKRCSDDVGFAIQMNNCSLFSFHYSLFIVHYSLFINLLSYAKQRTLESCNTVHHLNFNSCIDSYGDNQLYGSRSHLLLKTKPSLLKSGGFAYLVIFRLYKSDRLPFFLCRFFGL